MAEGALFHVLALGTLVFALAFVALRGARRIACVEDFTLAGRRLSRFTLAATIAATWVGAELVFETPAAAYRRGVAAYAEPWVASLALFVVMGVARGHRRHGSASFLELLERRYGPAARGLAGLSLGAAYLLVLATQLRAGGTLLGTLFPAIDGGTSIAAAMLCVLLLALPAGLVSVVATDVLLVLIALVTLAVGAGWLFLEAGGYDGVFAALPQAQRSLHLDFEGGLGLFLPAALVCLCDANLHQRFLAARTPEAARGSLPIAFLFVLALQAAGWIAVLSAVALARSGEMKVPVAEQEHRLLLNAVFEVMPAWLGPFVLVGLLGLVLSSASSFLLTAAHGWAHDLYRTFLAPNRRPDKYLFHARVSVGVCAFAALFLAAGSDRVFERAAMSSALYAGALAPSLLALYFWSRATARGSAASIFAGVLVGLGWHVFTRTSVQDELRASGWKVLADLSQWATRTELAPLVPGFLAAAGVLFLASLIGSPPEDEQARMWSRPHDATARSAESEHDGPAPSSMD